MSNLGEIEHMDNLNSRQMFEHLAMINGSLTEPMTAKEVKESNKKEIDDNIKRVEEKDDEITDKLMNYYRDDYNKKYDMNEKLNRQIMTKEKLIQINNNAYLEKKNKILLYKYILSYAFICFVMFLLYRFKAVSYNFLFNFLLFLLIAICVYLIYQRYYNSFSVGDNKTFYYSNDPVRNLLVSGTNKKATCPEGCKLRGEELPQYQLPDRGHKLREMRTDSTVNSWVDGDYPQYDPNKVNPKDPACKMVKVKEYDDETGESIDVEKKICYEPQPWYGPVDEASIKEYTCVRWGNMSSGMGKKSFKTTIPCKYYPGYHDQNE